MRTCSLAAVSALFVGSQLASAAPNITGVSDVTAVEGQKSVFTVMLTGPTVSGATARLSLANGTATIGTDFSSTLEYSNNGGSTYIALASNGTANIAAGISSFLIRISTLSDTVLEQEEKYYLDVIPVANMGTVRGFGIGTITDAGSPLRGIPNPSTIGGKPVVGQIRAVSNQIIENVHVTTSSGSCIVADGVTNVTIRNSEIGPCGQPGDPNTPADPNAHGVLIQNSSNVTIQRNVIHNVATGVYAVVSRNPIIMDRNYVYNVRGPSPRGQMIQMNEVTGGTAPSRVTCNISDAKPGIRFGVLHGDTDAGVEDHINLFQSSGLASGRTEIAYNHMRGGHKTSISGSGFVLGDLGGGYVNAHHNTVVDVANVGAGIAGGSNISIDHNRIYQHRDNVNYVNLGLMVWGQAGAACGGNLSVRYNRVWTLNSNGVQASYWNAGNCGAVDQTGNVFADASLSPAIFDEPESQCQ